MTAKKNSTDNNQIVFQSWEEFIGNLIDCSRRVVLDKNKNNLFSVSTFREEDGRIINRQKENVIFSQALLMDMDEGNCCPISFSEFFSGLCMFMYHSFSSTPEAKRWRVVIPFSKPIDEPTYNSIAKDMLEISKRNGFQFDQKKKRANDIMYFPCIPPDYPLASVHLFEDGRRSFPVDDWLSIKG